MTRRRPHRSVVERPRPLRSRFRVCRVDHALDLGQVRLIGTSNLKDARADSPKSPSLVKINSPSVSVSSRPTWKSRSLADRATRHAESDEQVGQRPATFGVGPSSRPPRPAACSAPGRDAGAVGGSVSRRRGSRRARDRRAVPARSRSGRSPRPGPRAIIDLRTPAVTPDPAWASTFCKRIRRARVVVQPSEPSCDSCAAIVGGRSAYDLGVGPAALSSASSSATSGRCGASAGSSVDAAQAHPLQEVAGGPRTPHGPGLGVVPGLDATRPAGRAGSASPRPR